MFDYIARLVSFIVGHQETFVMLIGLIGAIFKIYFDKMNAKDAIALIINTMKDEDKMKANRFSVEFFKKMEEVNALLNGGGGVLNQAKVAIRDLTENDHGTQIASYKGKPIFVNRKCLLGRVFQVFGR